MKASDPENELIEAAQEGDSRALDELLRRHQDQIYRFGLRMCGDREDAEDIVQVTMLAMARGIDGFRGGSSLSTWLYSIARNACIKKRRRGKHAPDVLEPLDEGAALVVSDARRNPEEHAADKEIEHAVARAIGELDPKYREVLVLRDVEGLTAAEVGRIVDATPQAVKTRLHRARLAVRTKIAPLLEIADDATAAKPCSDVLTTYSRYLEGELSSEICADMQKHLEKCSACRHSCKSLQKMLGLCRTVGRFDKVPPAVQLSVKTALRDFLRQG